ncbi:MAG TPA: glycosyltransferase family 2 protein, partial [Chthoniobacteraceae bacterium]|nr:glycosyltransferase family 2 protein [Chthoniobacteraceae bacterium]
PCLNGAPYVEAAIESVRRQTGTSFEHIVLDGGSTDGTMAILGRHPHLRVLSEPDRGLYDASNKGLRLARGEIIGILNSDDFYVGEVFSAVAGAFSRPEIVVVTGGAEVFAEEAGRRRRVRAIVGDGALRLDLGNLLAGVPLLNSRFFRRSFVELLGEFDLALRIAADREWLLRAALRQPVQMILPEIIYAYRQHEGSLTVHESDRNVALYRREHVDLAETHLSRKDLSESDRRALTIFHTRESSAVASLAVFDGQFKQWVALARRGWRINRFWPLAFTWRLAAHSLGR